MLTEHKMRDFEIDRLNINNFQVISSYSRSSTSGGGVVILSKAGVKAKEICIPAIQNLTIEKEFECCLVEIKTNRLTLVLAGVYRTPRHCFTNIFLDKLNILLEILNKTYVNVVVAGDINIDVLESSSACSKLMNIVESHSMYCSVNFPTRVCETRESSIDQIITNIDKSKITVTGLITEISDHDGQLFDINFDISTNLKNKTLTTTRRKFTEKNNVIFLSLMAQETWIDVYNAPVNDKYDVFNCIFMYYFNLCFPVVKCRQSKTSTNWINQEIIKSKQKIENLSKINRLSRDKDVRLALKTKKRN